jgi:hypothetical protein
MVYVMPPAQDRPEPVYLRLRGAPRDRMIGHAADRIRQRRSLVPSD